ncbi:glycosyltransferase family 4 protein [Candidatus Uhrbacteria bacterium]|nr:glycosyltransferase family 4 protein [Candidatus Uhrbacteria bacterium]
MNSVRKQKFAVLTPVFSPYHGGIGVVAHANAKMAHERGADVTVFTPWYSSLRKKEVPSNETVDGVKVKRIHPFFSYGNAALVPQLFFQLRNFDKIHLHYPFLEVAIPVLFAHLFFKKKYILTYHMDLVGKGALNRFIFQAYTAIILPLILRYADAIIVSSLDYTRASRLGKYIGQYRAKMIVLPHSVDTNVYIRRETKSQREQYGLKEGQQTILFVGGLDSAHYFKGVEYLLEAFESLVRMMEERHDHPLPVLILVGSGNMISYYKNIAGQLGIADKVIFAGSADSQESLAQQYSLATVTVLPSIDQSESFGIVLIESLACGTPVIASDLPGIRSVVKDGVNGFLVSVKDVNALAVKLHSLLRSPQEARNMGDAGRAIIEKEYSYRHIKELFGKVV